MSSLCGVWLHITTSMRWVDHIDKDDMDIFFDRAVIIIINHKDENSYLKTHKTLTMGVLISREHVLTSFNPFREYIKIKEKRKDVTVSILYERQISNWQNVSYTLQNFTIDCARQIVPIPSDENVWHDDNQEQSPLHDLMVMRLNRKVDLIPEDPALYSFDQYQRTGVVNRTAGPMKTPLAKPHHALGREIKFSSLGFINRRHIFKFCVMRSHTFDPEDNVQTLCDSWIPREFGLFICIRNIENFKNVGSGALLIFRNRLFGIGGFLLKKGNSSILVFTDVRPYNHLVHETCTIEDQKLEIRTTTEYDPFATTTTTTTTTA